SCLDQMTDPIIPIQNINANFIVNRIQPNEEIGKGLLRYEGSLFERLLKKIFFKWNKIIESNINLLGENNYYIKISTGCLSNCSYCAVRRSRGHLLSKSIEDIINEFNIGLGKNYHYFSLLGTDLGAYGKDLGYTLNDLLKKLIKIEGNYNIGLRNVNLGHLKNMLDEFLFILKSKKIYYIEIPIESGSNRILKLMNRNYTVEEFKKCIKEIRKAYPNIIIRSQMMVGFPTESEKDFVQTMNLLDDVTLDYVEVYQYSSRPGTYSAMMDFQISEKIKKQRFYKLFLKSQFNRLIKKIQIVLKNKK
ncbi:MAG: radical SAM protein, partial [Candidatus Hodarchaeota archaeon]